LALSPAVILGCERIDAGIDADVTNKAIRALDKVSYLIDGSLAETTYGSCHGLAPSLPQRNICDEETRLQVGAVPVCVAPDAFGVFFAQDFSLSLRCPTNSKPALRQRPTQVCDTNIQGGSATVLVGGVRADVAVPEHSDDSTDDQAKQNQRDQSQPGLGRS
jgi:hypothetical protein